MSFEVIAYSTTNFGREAVEAHPSRPLVSQVIPCPTIDALGREKRTAFRRLCIGYDPTKSSPDALGHGDVGALIAFAHGVPNNAPLIFHKKSAKWAPLFPARTTSATRTTFASDGTEVDAIRSHLLELRQKRLAESPWLDNVKPQSRALFAVLAALARPPRDSRTLSTKTGLTLIEVDEALVTATSHGWITDTYRLTDAGQAELENARKSAPTAKVLPQEPERYYYPKALRAPSGVSS
jgi:hypothetical protein